MRLERQPEGAAGLSDHSHILSYFRLLLIAATLWCLFTQCTASGFKEQTKGHGLAGHGTPSKKAHRVGDTVACKRKVCIPVSVEYRTLCGSICERNIEVRSYENQAANSQLNGSLGLVA